MRNPGISSLVVVFLSICLITFACLTLSSEVNNANLSRQNATYKTNYYNSCNKAETLLNHLSKGESLKSTGASVKGMTASWIFKINENQSLLVKLDLESGNIKEWKTVTADKKYNQVYNLIQ